MPELSFEDALVAGVGAPPGSSPSSSLRAGPAPATPIVPPYVEQSIRSDRLNSRDADSRRRAYLSPEELAADNAFDQTPGNLKELDDQIQRYSINPKDSKKLKILQDERTRLRRVGQRSAADIDPGGMGGGEEDMPPSIQAPDGTGLSYDKDKGEFVQKSPQPMQRVLSFEEAARGVQLTSQGQPVEKITPSGEKKFGPLDYGIAYAKGIGGEVASVADIILGIPGMMAALGVNIHTSVRAEAEGQDFRTAQRAGREASAAFPEDLANTSPAGSVLSKLLFNPVYNALKLIGQEGLYEGSTTTAVMGDVSKAIVRAGDYLETKTNGAVTTESFQNLADTLMVAAGARGGDLGAKALKDRAGRSAAEKEAEVQKVRQEDPLPVEQGPQVTAQEQINQMLDIKSTAEREKYDATRRKEVRAAFKKDPDYANYLDSLATQRVEQHDAWTRDVEKADTMQRRMEEKEAMRTSMPPNVDVPLDGPQIHYPEYTFDDVLRIMQKPAEGRDAGDLLTLKLWNRQVGKTSLENILWAGTAVGAGITGAKIYLNYQNTGFMFPSLQKREERLDEGEPRPNEEGNFLAKAKEDTLAAIPLVAGALLGAKGERVAKFTKDSSGAITFNLTKSETKFFDKLHLSEPDKVEFLSEVPGASYKEGKLSVPDKASVSKLQDYVDKTVSTVKGEGQEALPPSFYKATFASLAREEAPVKVIESKAPVTGKQEGSIDSRLLASLAAAGIGVTAGIALDPKNKIEGAILGALGGLALAKLSPKGVVDVVKAVWKPDTRIRINDLANSLDTKILRGARATMQLQEAMHELKLSDAERISVTHAVEANDLSKLSPQQRKLASLLTDNFKKMAEVAVDRGVLKSAIDNYVTHLWKFGDQTRDRLMEAFGRRPGVSMSPETKFALARKVPTIAEGKARGLTPLTEDPIVIAGIYNNAVTRALANQEFLASLRNQVDQTTGSRLIMPASTAPKGFVHIDHPQLLGKLVHPDIASSMRFMFDTTDPGAMVRGAVAINQITKRMAVSFSMFHAKALLDAFTGAAAVNKKLMVGGAVAGAALGAVTDDKLLTKAMIGAGIGMMLPGMKHVAQAAAPRLLGENKYVKMIREGKEGDEVDHAMRDGLTFQIKRGKSVDEDVGHFYEGMKDIQKGLDSLVPHLGTPVKAFTAVNHAVDGFMWERLHAGMKLSIYAEKKAQLIENNEKAHAHDPVKSPRMSVEKLGEEAAKFTNDIFGGINWRRAAEEARTKWGRDMALAVYSPTGRMINQLLMFAPDWTLSTTRAALRAVGEVAGYGEGTGLRGMMSPKNATDLSRQYILRSALYYATIGDGINYALSGHHIWDNKDWTTIDMGDGRRMQWSKHTMEPVHWLTKPGQQALNKLGFVPREAANQLMGSEYLSTSGHAPRMNTSLGGRAFHAAKGFSPIAVQQSFDAGAGSGIAGFLGAPIYGVTDKQKMENRELKKFRRAMEGLKK